LLTVEQVAVRLSMTPETVRRYLRRKQIRGLRFGGRGGWRVAESDLAAFIEAHKA